MNKLFSCAWALPIAFLASTSFAEPRPDQYVLLAFDGSQSIGMWQATREFARDMTAKGKPVKFTYFISSVYYVGAGLAKQGIYAAPGGHGHASAIGWGGDHADLLRRYNETNFAKAEQNEIASHACGHWDGSSWSEADWSSEFKQFHNFIFNFLQVNSLKATPEFPNGWVFNESNMKGFRAPQLGQNDHMFQVLKDYQYRYDTSLTNSTNYWPEKLAKGNTWNFPLASLRIAGTGKRTLSMDYNFYVADSGANPNPNEADRYRKQMLQTYLQYFQSNYNGNRAPIHIGHHFSQWNGGAYWAAMKEFAEAVCGLPEVKCVTYSELADFMDRLTPAQRYAYKTGTFDKLSSQIQITDATMRPLNIDVQVAGLSLGGRFGIGNSVTNITGNVKALLSGSRQDQKDVQVELSINGQSVGPQIDIQDLRSRYTGRNISITARAIKPDGTEVARSTHEWADIGLATESYNSTAAESVAMRGDLPQAHMDEEP